VTCARENLDVSRTAPILGHREVGALGRVRHDCLGGRKLLALHARPSHRVARARRGSLIQGGIALQLAHQGEVRAMLAAKPRGFAGAIAGIPHKDERALWEPPHHARQQEPGQMRWRSMAPPMRLIPLGGALTRRPTPGAPRA
jgi:hypothetical protein